MAPSRSLSFVRSLALLSSVALVGCAASVTAGDGDARTLSDATPDAADPRCPLREDLFSSGSVCPAVGLYCRYISGCNIEARCVSRDGSSPQWEITGCPGGPLDPPELVSFA